MTYNSCKPTNYKCDFKVQTFGCCNPCAIVLDADKPETLNWSEVSIPKILYLQSETPGIENIEQIHAKAEITNVKLVETPYCFKSKVYDLVKLDNNGKPIILVNGNYDIAEKDVVFYLAPLEPLCNESGSYINGRKLIVEGNLIEKIVYTADVNIQSVHSVNYKTPFSSFIIPYTKVEGMPKSYSVIDPLNPTYLITITAYKSDELIIDLYEEFTGEVYIEDIYITNLDSNTMFKNVSLFLTAKPIPSC